MKKFFLLFLLLKISIVLFAQSKIVTFTCEDTCGHYVQMDRIVINNLTRGWQEVMYWPDTVLRLYEGEGAAINHYMETGNKSLIALSQNNPNPFKNKTSVSLRVMESGYVTIEVTDVVGRMVMSKDILSQPGNYKLQISLSTAGLYFLTAQLNGQKSSIKMINQGDGGVNTIEISDYKEENIQADKVENSSKGDCTQAYHSMDWLEYYCYAVVDGNDVESSHISQRQEMIYQTIKFRLPTGEDCKDARPCIGMPVVTDYDGNTYNTVRIGKQCWMKQNLRTTRYANGDTIYLGNNNLSLEVPYMYYPNNNAGAVNSYGYLYNWAALMHASSSSNTNPSGVQGICPKGWHVPSDVEWQQLVDYVSSRSDYQWSCATCIAKSLAYTYGWTSYSNNNVVGGNQSANNATGFSALPAGHCGYGGGQIDFGDKAFFWGATECNAVYTYLRILNYDDAHVTRYGNDKKYGFSVRCICDSLPQVSTSPVSGFTNDSFDCGGNVTAVGNFVSSRGVCWSTSHNPTLADNHTTDGAGVGSFNSYIIGLNPSTTYYIRAYATNPHGTVYGEEVSVRTANVGVPCTGGSTVVDYDGNIYEAVQIGNQCWMKENLRTTHFADGTSIGLGDETCQFVIPHRYPPFNDPSWLSSGYGYIYNWAAVMHGASSSNTVPSHVQGICPNGWHVPSDAEWNEMEAVLTSDVELNTVGDRGNHGGKLAGGFSGSWDGSAVEDSPGDYASVNRNITGFSALPASEYSCDYHLFGMFEFSSNEGKFAFFWTTTEGGLTVNTAWARRITYNSAGVKRGWAAKTDSFSVRCVRDL